VLLLHVGSRESGMTDRATEGLLIRICPSLVRSSITSSERDAYECDDVSPDARFGRRSDHKSHTSSNVSSARLRRAASLQVWGRRTCWLLKRGREIDAYLPRRTSGSHREGPFGVVGPCCHVRQSTRDCVSGGVERSIGKAP
jgi:hypothetical protein